MADSHSENTTVEQPAIALFRELGWETANCYRRDLRARRRPGARDAAPRSCCVPRLRAALERLNPDAAAEAIELAIEELTRDRSRDEPGRGQPRGLRPAQGRRQGHACRERGRRRGGRDGPRHRLGQPRQQRLLPGLAVLGHRRALHAPRRPGRLRQRPAAGLHRAEGRRTSAWSNAYRRQPARLQGHHPAALLVQRASSSSPTAARAASAASPPRGSTSPSGRRSTAKASRASSRWRRCSAASASRPGCSTWSRTSPCSPRRQGGLVKLVAKNHQYLGVNNAIAGRAADPRQPGQAGRLLAHAGQRQELLDGLLRPEGAAQAARQLDLRRRHRPRRPGRPDLQELRRRRRGHRAGEARPRRQRRAPASSCCAKTTATSSP